MVNTREILWNSLAYTEIGGGGGASGSPECLTGNRSYTAELFKESMFLRTAFE